MLSFPQQISIFPAKKINNNTVLLTNKFSGMMTQLKPRILVITKAIMVHPNPTMD